MTSPEEMEEIEWFDGTLNESQRKAVRFVLGMQEVGCIHGPPGVSESCPFEFACDGG